MQDIITMKQNIHYILTLFLVAFTLSGCFEDSDAPCVPLEAITIDSETTPSEVAVGQKVRITYSCTPSDATLGEVKWTTSDPEIATVDDRGVVSPLSPGDVTITVTAKGKSSSVDLKVYDPKSGFVTFDTKEKSLVVGEMFALEPHVGPATLKERSLTWKSSDESVATVTSMGIIKAITPGEALISASLSNGEKAECKVVVKATFSLIPESLDVIEGESVQIEVNDPAKRLITWSSSDPTIAKVDAKGLVTAILPGEVDIIATTALGEAVKCHVTVKLKPMPQISLGKSSLELVITQTYRFKVKNGQGRNLIWSSSDESVATVDENGVVTTLKVGETVITVKDVKYGQSSECRLSVKEIPTDPLTLDNEIVTLYTSDVAQLRVTNGSGAALTWSSSDTNIATVSRSGMVTAISPGEATISVRDERTYKKGTCRIKVIDRTVRTIRVTPAEMSVTVGYVRGYNLEVLPLNASNTEVDIWSEDPSIAEAIVYDKRNVIFGKKVGHTVIHFATKDRKKETTMSVTVNPPAIESISISYGNLSMKEGDQTKLTAISAPSSALTPAVTWSSSNPSVATVDENGLVKAIAKGTATITARVKDSMLTARCEISVISGDAADVPGQDL